MSNAECRVVDASSPINVGAIFIAIVFIGRQGERYTYLYIYIMQIYTVCAYSTVPLAYLYRNDSLINMENTTCERRNCEGPHLSCSFPRVSYVLQYSNSCMYLS